jgi:transcriptional regulator with XRE-family HTH domain
MAREVGAAVGREVRLARTNHALSRRRAAALAGVSAQTQGRVELGDPTVRLDTLCRVAAALGLRVWGRAFPHSAPTLRDTGQLWIADRLLRAAHSSWTVSIEAPLGNLRSADAVLYGPEEVIHVEIERALADFQAQYRAAAEKRDELAAIHHRPVRLVMAIEDSRRNRDAVRRHPAIRTALPAGSREVLASVRVGRHLGRDGLLWVRRRGGGVA